MFNQNLLVDGEWINGDGATFESKSPSTNQIYWEGNAASSSQVDDAFSAARAAAYSWMDVSVENRIEICKKFADIVRENQQAFAEVISNETGKPLWESKTEAGAVAAKVDVSIDAMAERRSTLDTEANGIRSVTRFRPFGVVGVLGPFNFPAHLPNGHIVPAILAGNTVVFKPSEQTPAVAEQMMKYWLEAGLQPGVVNMVHGASEIGIAIVNHPDLDGLYFTGSSRAGIAINKALAGNPGKIVALEMGGNNPLIVHQAKDLRAAAYHTILSAYFTAGQRCTCARRLIVVDSPETDAFLEVLKEMIGNINVGLFTDSPEPFMGTVISAAMGDRLIEEQNKLIKYGGKPIVKMEQLRDCKALVSPGLIDMTHGANMEDEEVFGPLLSVYRVADFENAIVEANNTRYGLSAGLLSDSESFYKEFIRKIRAGIVNWNRQTTGASGRLPFGGCGLSGNHRPAGYYSTDYCSWPVASLESSELSIPEKSVIGIEV